MGTASKGWRERGKKKGFLKQAPEEEPSVIPFKALYKASGSTLGSDVFLSCCVCVCVCVCACMTNSPLDTMKGGADVQGVRLQFGQHVLVKDGNMNSNKK